MKGQNGQMGKSKETNEVKYGREKRKHVKINKTE